MVIVAVLLVVLLVTGALPFLTGSSKGVGGALSYSQASPIAYQTASGYQGGGWALIAAVGFDSTSSESVPVNSSSSGTGSCNLSLAPGAPDSISLSAYSGSRAAGLAPTWEFLYRNGAGTILIVIEIDGSAAVLATLSGGLCSSIFGLFSAIPAGVIDSTQAAAAVAPEAATFLAEYPHANASFGLSGGVSFFGKSAGPTWGIAMSSCSLMLSSPATGTEFNATVSAVNGSVSFNETRTGVACKGSVSLAANSTDLELALVNGGLARALDRAILVH